MPLSPTSSIHSPRSKHCAYRYVDGKRYFTLLHPASAIDNSLSGLVSLLSRELVLKPKSDYRVSLAFIVMFLGVGLLAKMETNMNSSKTIIDFYYIVRAEICRSAIIDLDRDVNIGDRVRQIVLSRVGLCWQGQG